jgi:hypothetical protein
MQTHNVKVLLKSYLGDIKIPDDLVMELEAYMESSYSDGFDLGYDDGYRECQEEQEDV